MGEKAKREREEEKSEGKSEEKIKYGRGKVRMGGKAEDNQDPYLKSREE